MNPPSQKWTESSKSTLLLSVVIQPPTFRPLTSQAPISQPTLHRYTFSIPTCAPFQSQSQAFNSTEYRHHPENFLNGIKARTFYQLGPEPTNSQLYRNCNIRRMAVVGNCLDSPISSRFNTLSQTDTQNWSVF